MKIAIDRAALNARIADILANRKKPKRETILADSVNRSVSSGNAFLSQAEIAQAMGVTRSRVQQIEQSALKKIKRAIEEEAKREGKSIRQWLLEC